MTINDRPLIDLPEVLDAMRAVVAHEGEDFIYSLPQCVYVDDDGPSCIVGQVIDRLDPNLLSQRAVEENDAASALQGFTSAALDALDAAQMAQDGVTYSDTWDYHTGRLVDNGGGGYSRGTWGQALAAAEGTL